MKRTPYLIAGRGAALFYHEGSAGSFYPDIIDELNLSG